MVRLVCRVASKYGNGGLFPILRNPEPNGYYKNYKVTICSEYNPF